MGGGAGRQGRKPWAKLPAHLLPKRHDVARLVALQHSGICVPENRRVTECAWREQRARGVLEIEHVFADEPEGLTGFRFEISAATGGLIRGCARWLCKHAGLPGQRRPKLPVENVVEALERGCNQYDCHRHNEAQQACHMRNKMRRRRQRAPHCNYSPKRESTQGSNVSRGTFNSWSCPPRKCQCAQRGAAAAAREAQSDSNPRAAAVGY